MKKNLQVSIKSGIWFHFLISKFRETFTYLYNNRLIYDEIEKALSFYLEPFFNLCN